MARILDGVIQIYKIEIDDFGDITLGDVNRFEDVVKAYGELREAFKTVHNELQEKLSLPGGLR